MTGYIDIMLALIGPAFAALLFYLILIRRDNRACKKMSHMLRRENRLSR